MITEEDINNAKENNISNLKRITKEELMRIAPDNFISIEDAITYEVSEENCSHNTGDKVDRFSCSVRIKAQTFAISKRHIEDFSKKSILQNIPKENTIKEDLEINYYLKNNENEKMELDIEIKAKEYKNIDLQSLKENILGMSIEEAKNTLKSKTGSDSIEINKNLFWKNSISKNINKLELNIKFN